MKKLFTSALLSNFIFVSSIYYLTPLAAMMASLIFGYELPAIVEALPLIIIGPFILFIFYTIAYILNILPIHAIFYIAGIMNNRRYIYFKVIVFSIFSLGLNIYSKFILKVLTHIDLTQTYFYYFDICFALASFIYAYLYYGPGSDVRLGQAKTSGANGVKARH